MLKKIYFLIATILMTVLLLGSVNFVFAAGDKELTDDEKAAFIVRDEWTGWVRDFTASLSELDQLATAKIYDDMDFYDMQYRFTEKYKKVPEYLDEDGKPTQKLKDMIKEKRKKIAGAAIREFLCFTSKQDGSTVSLVGEGSASLGSLQLGISTDGVSFTSWDGSAKTINSGESVWVWNKNTTFSTSYSNYYHFVLTGNVGASGSVDSMINFAAISSNCFNSMFMNQTALTKAPELPSTTLAESCYARMFSGCTGLKEAPELPATTVARLCYDRMFMTCTGLTKGPSILPAKKLAESCYVSLFHGCSNLVEAPILPATTLANNCYQNIFRSCAVLNSITMNYPFASMDAMGSYCSEWVNGVSNTGTFYCSMPIAVENYAYGASRMPKDDSNKWTVVNSWINH